MEATLAVPALTGSDDEVPFEITEFFVSRTDIHGIIESGSDVFVRVSGYSAEELLGRPHNIVRHPDMPKAVFKLFWDMLKRNEPVCAYVKNRAKSGKHYWVVATAFPIENGYLSVRFKPSSPLLPAVEALYRDLLSVESVDGVEAAERLLGKRLSTLGFADYGSFMREMLRQEVLSRDQRCAGMRVNARLPSADASSRALEEIVSAIGGVSRNLAKLTAGSRTAASSRLTVETQGDRIFGACGKLDTISTNMSISSQKLGKEGSTLSVVAATFQHNSAGIMRHHEAIKASLERIAVLSPQITSGTFLCRLLVDMIETLSLECLAQMAASHGQAIGERTLANLRELGVLFTTLHTRVGIEERLQTEYVTLLGQVRKDLRSLRQLVLRLDLIRTGGKLEGARTLAIAERFRPFLMDMGRLIVEVEAPVAASELETAELSERCDAIARGLREVAHLLDESGVILTSVLNSVGPAVEKKAG